MNDVLSIVNEDIPDIECLESEIVDLSYRVTELEEDNCKLTEELESLRLETEEEA